MSNAYTTYRTELMATLAASLTEYSFNAGEPPKANPPATTPLGYVWIENSAQLASNKLVEEIIAGVRLYVVWGQRVDAQTPVDPTPVEQAAEDLQTTLAPAQTPGDPWFYEVLSITFDNDNGYIEAAVKGTRWNDFAVS